jgi:hypothetical protein
MNLTTFAKCMLFIAVSVMLATCRKFDFTFRDPAKHCRIDEFKGVLYKGEPNEVPVTRKIHYNEYGNPTLVEYVDIGDGTGFPNFYFHYNEKQQLVHMVGYGDHRYFYNDLGQIKIDSSYEYYTGGDARFETRFFYDLYGRVIKTTRKYYYDKFEQEGVGETTTGHIRYDQRGNRVRQDATYDNKTSIFRTHPLWQFLNLDYSVNNPVKATSYNAAGLPLTFGNEFYYFLEASISADTVIYNCGDANH